MICEAAEGLGRSTRDKVSAQDGALAEEGRVAHSVLKKLPGQLAEFGTQMTDGAERRLQKRGFLDVVAADQGDQRPQEGGDHTSGAGPPGVRH